VSIDPAGLETQLWALVRMPVLSDERDPTIRDWLVSDSVFKDRCGPGRTGAEYPSGTLRLGQLHFQFRVPGSAGSSSAGSGPDRRVAPVVGGAMYSRGGARQEILFLIVAIGCARCGKRIFA
jgi:hypothetical protein